MADSDSRCAYVAMDSRLVLKASWIDPARRLALGGPTGRAGVQNQGRLMSQLARGRLSESSPQRHSKVAYEAPYMVCVDSTPVAARRPMSVSVAVGMGAFLAASMHAPLTSVLTFAAYAGERLSVLDQRGHLLGCVTKTDPDLMFRARLSVTFRSPRYAGLPAR